MRAARIASRSKRGGALETRKSGDEPCLAHYQGSRKRSSAGGNRAAGDQVVAPGSAGIRNRAVRSTPDQRAQPAVREAVARALGATASRRTGRDGKPL